MHNLNSVLEGGGYKHDGIKYYCGDYQPHHVASGGDLIVANTEQGHHRLLIGYAAIVPEHFGSESLFSHHLYRVRVRERSSFSPDYLCHLLNTSVMHDTVSGYANGTTVNMLPIDALRNPLVAVPPAALVHAFSQFAAAGRIRQECMREESRTLSALRDSLLPKLISGELRVKDAERLAVEAGAPVP
jgi:type I restriction enzyme S subunit